jgi:hypothetical protein
MKYRAAKAAYYPKLEGVLKQISGIEFTPCSKFTL